ncbi:hypothetical protein FOG50_01508 [Hanseniaspora uvarum]|uniref:[PSI+] induction protein 2 n=1 Tax=Hanseniaspora uvarum TaxID=29833 RepID=A0A1E5RRH7_HANUV|nr:hypothetical protein FOG50_01508 [Hanseniaspora uvarum]OEJ89519.1 [PSI+] induction protein 2 [Hanseniaspora uvarum]GMM42381.1 Pin2 protein [Hanseniaspora uvarum]
MTAIKQYLLKPTSSIPTKRSISSSVSGTYDSAKHWNTCMANKPCKIIAIILIVICAIVVFWLLGSLLKVLRSGCEGFYGVCCWPCSMNSNRSPSNTHTTYVQPQQQPPVYYQQQPQPVYTSNRNDYNRVFEDDYQMESTQDFDLEEQKRKSMRKNQKTQQENNNDNESWYNYNPFSSDHKQSKY